MKKFSYVLFILILFVAFASAQTKDNPYSGKLLLTGEGGATYSLTDQDSKLAFASMRGGLEYMFPFKSNHTFGLRVLAGYNHLEGEKGTYKFWNNVYDLKVGLLYGINMGGFLPYLSGGMNYPIKYTQTIGDEPKKKMAAFGEVGFKYAVAEWLSVNLSGTLNFTGTDYVDLKPPINKNDAYVTGQLGISLMIGLVAKDEDQDGVVDSKDFCPNTPFGVQVDENGCPLDMDKDAVPDYLDKCPNTPAGIPVDANGCPFDSDRDGVLDYLDKCPNTPNGVTVDKNGCPLDTDKDGVLDYLDKCPNTPPNTKVDKDGCPIVVEKKEITLEGMTTFKTGKADLTDGAKAELEQVAQFIKERPTSKWVVEGHTDSKGNAKSNKKLSENRAKSVVNFLISKGVAKTQLSYTGYGQEMPVASNDTEEGRQKNRRVVIKRTDLK